jgi:hypothetical protein
LPRYDPLVVYGSRKIQITYLPILSTTRASVSRSDSHGYWLKYMY